MEELREGYKQTDIGIIPEDWNAVKLCTLGTFTKGNGIAKTESNSGYLGAIRYGELYTNYNNYIKIPKTFISKNVAKKARRIQFGDILFAGSGETKEDIGKCATLLYRKECYAGGDIIIFTPKDCNSLFLGFVLNSANVQSQKATKGQGDAVVHISLSALQNLQIAIPKNIKEQSSIAGVLSDIDALIEALEQKIAKKRTIKEGAMQELLTGKKRLAGFYEPWVEIKLGDIFDVNKGVQINRAILSSDSGEYPVMNGGIEPSGYNNSYNNIAETIIISEGGNSCGYVNYITKRFWAGGHCYVISPKIAVDLKFLYFSLKRSESAIMQLRTGSGLPNIQKKRLLDEFEILFTKNTKEQQTIAQILTDMDDEIDSLEREQAKYTALKQGAMQKLLTGEIRLVNTSAQLQKQAEIRTIPVAAHIVGGHIVNKLHGSKGWGRTKLQKSIHLVCYYCQFDLGAHFIQNTAGPDDQKLMNHIDSKFKTYRHVRIDELRDKEGKRHYNYTPTPKIEEVEQAFENYPEETQKAINLLLDKIWGMDLARAEIVSTLYAVWNNRIIKEQPINDDLLLKDFYDWSAHKSDFSPDLVLRGLSYMRNNGIVPVGWGRYIDKK